jgi:hypothetical protein
MENKKVFLVIDSKIQGFKAVIGAFDNLNGAVSYVHDTNSSSLNVVEMNVSKNQGES